MNYTQNRAKMRWITAGLFLLLLLFMLAAMQFGPASVTVDSALRTIGSKLPLIGKAIDMDGISIYHQNIVWKLRVPRVLLAAIAGAALSASGAVYQAVFRNPMADPYVLGISSGAALGAALAIVFGVGASVLGLSTITFTAFIGAVISGLVVWGVAGGGRKSTPMTLLLSGIALNFLLSAMLSMLMVFHREKVEKIIFWTMGSFSAASWTHVLILLIPVIVGVLAFRFFARDLNLMLMGEDTARGLGVHVQRVRFGLLIVSSLVTAAVVSVSGVIGFVGLIVPHAIRLISGPDHRTLIPLSAIGGGIFLVLADTLARTAAAPAEIPIGAVTALTGAPYFLFLLQRKQGRFGG